MNMPPNFSGVNIFHNHLGTKSQWHGTLGNRIISNIFKSYFSFVFLYENVFIIADILVTKIFAKIEFDC